MAAHGERPLFWEEEEAVPAFSSMIAGALAAPTPRPRRRIGLRLACAALILISLVAGAYALREAVVWRQAQVAEHLRQTRWALERARHPFEYRQLIEDYASEQQLDPALVAAVIMSESSFRPTAESRLGARGLMQLMPDTAEWIAPKLSEPFDWDALFDPETNIRFGCWFLGYLSREFKGDLTKMAAAYHAGGGRVKEWLQNPAYTEAGALVVIPFEDTEHYVTKVMNAYAVYRAHYYPEPEETDDAS